MCKKLTLGLLSCLLFVLLPSQARAGGRTILIDNFSAAALGAGQPRGWELKENKGKASIKIESENGNKVLHLVSRQSSFALKKELEIDLKKYPIITWRWKVTRLPKGGDVRRKDKDDQAAQLYLHFAKFPRKINFWEIGYIWDSLTPKGSILPSQNIYGSRVQYIVLQSGPQKLGQWVSERRNVYQDHKKLFGKEPPELQGIILMVDADNTNSSAECYFDDLVFQER